MHEKSEIQMFTKHLIGKRSYYWVFIICVAAITTERVVEPMCST